MKTGKSGFLSVGIDVGADFSLMAIASPTQEIICRPYKILHESEKSVQGAIDRIRDFEKRYGLSVKVFMESTSVYHLPLYYRLKSEGLDARVLNPLITHAGRDMNVRSVHNDKFDAKKIALLGLKPDIKTSIVPSDEVAAIKALVREYHTLKKSLTQYICRLKLQLRQIFPQFLPLFSQVNGKAAMEILDKYPSPDTLLAATDETVVGIIKRASGKGQKAAEDKCARLKKAAEQAKNFGHSNSGNVHLVRHYVEMIRLVEKQTDSLLDTIRMSVDEQPDSLIYRQVKLLETIPGVGFVTAVTLICEIGDFTAFKRPKQLYAYFGLDPRVRQSGNNGGVDLKMSKRGSPYARRSLYMLALQSVSLRKNGEPKNPALRAYYEKKCASKAKMTALGAVMHKVCNIIFAVLRDEKAFSFIAPEEHKARYQEHKTEAAA